MNRTTLLYVVLLSAALLAIAAGCVSPGGNITTPTVAPTSPTPTPTATATLQTATGPSPSITPGLIAGTGTPDITILFPRPDSAITSTDVEVGVLVENFSLGESGSAGHIVYYLDAPPLTAPNVTANMTLTPSVGASAVSTDTTYTWKDLSPGIHSFAVELVDQNNKPFEPPVLDVVEPVAVGPGATVPPTPTGPVFTLGTIGPLPPVASETTATTPTATPTTAATTATPTATLTTTATTATPTTATATATPTPTAAPTTATPTATVTGGGQSVTIGLTAHNIAYNVSTITVPAGADVTVDFTNEDSGIPHNFAVYDSPAAQTVIFKGQIITGPASIQYHFTAPSTPGTYFFRCDVHPTIMTGQFIVQ